MAILGEVTLKVVTDESIERGLMVTTKPVEDGFSIGDGIKREPLRINLSFVIVDEEGNPASNTYRELERISEAGKPVSYKSEQKAEVFENMVIEKLTLPKDSSIKNGFKGSISLVQVMVVKQETTAITGLGKDPITQKKVQTTNGSTDKRTVQTEGVDTNTINSSILYKMLNGKGV